MLKSSKMSYSLKKEIFLNAPKAKVWETYRDSLPQLVSAMPTVEKIKVLSREEVKEGVRLVNRWKISGGLPRAIKKIIPSRLLSYDDEATWNQKEYVCYFIEKPIDGSGIYLCKGKNTFEDKGEKTLLTIAFELTIYPEKIPGVPTFVARKLVPKIEQIISKEVAKNLALTAKVVERHMNQKLT